MPLPTILSSLMAGAGGYAGGHAIHRMLRPKDPYAMLKTLGAVGGGSLVLALILRKLMKKKQEEAPEGPQFLPMPGGGGGEGGVNVTVNPTLTQLLGSPGVGAGTSVSAPPEKMGSEKTAGPLNWLKGLVGRGRPNIPRASMTGQMLGQPGGLLSKVVGGPLRSLGRISGLGGHMGRRDFTKTLGGENIKYMDEILGSLKKRGKLPMGTFMPSFGIGSRRGAARGQDFLRTYGKFKGKNLTGFSDEAMDAFRRMGPEGQTMADDLLNMFRTGKRVPRSASTALSTAVSQSPGAAGAAAGRMNPQAWEAFIKNNPRWHDYLLPAGVGAGIYAGTRGGEEPGNLVDLPRTRPPGNFLTEGMGGIGDWLGEQGMDSLGNWIKNNPYMSAGVGGGGLTLLIYLLSQMFNKR